MTLSAGNYCSEIAGLYRWRRLQAGAANQRNLKIKHVTNAGLTLVQHLQTLQRHSSEVVTFVNLLLNNWQPDHVFSVIVCFCEEWKCFICQRKLLRWINVETYITTREIADCSFLDYNY